MWLFGSHANGAAGPESDWDYMAFADEATRAALCDDSRFHRIGIDLMIVTDGDQFAAPWTDQSRAKSGRLAKVDGGWHWNKLSATEVTYRATKPPAAKGWDVQVFEQCARRVYPQKDEDAAGAKQATRASPSSELSSRTCLTCSVDIL